MRRPNPKTRAFTTIELAVYLTILAIAIVATGGIFQAIQRNTIDQAVAPLLGAAVLSARDTAAVNNYTYPPNSAATVSVLNTLEKQHTTADLHVRYTTAPATPANIPDGKGTINISTHTPDPQTITFATSATQKNNQCWLAYENVQTGALFAKVQSDNLPADYCTAPLIAACASTWKTNNPTTGTLQNPIIIPETDTCLTNNT